MQIFDVIKSYIFLKNVNFTKCYKLVIRRCQFDIGFLEIWKTFMISTFVQKQKIWQKFGKIWKIW